MNREPVYRYFARYGRRNTQRKRGKPCRRSLAIQAWKSSSETRSPRVTFRRPLPGCCTHKTAISELSFPMIKEIARAFLAKKQLSRKTAMASKRVVIMSTEIKNSMPECNLTFEDCCTSLQAKPTRYGLPCAKCRAYYEADLTVCPVCNCGERVPARVEISNISSSF
jgi:hypothetical protein